MLTQREIRTGALDRRSSAGICVRIMRSGVRYVRQNMRTQYLWACVRKPIVASISPLVANTHIQAVCTALWATVDSLTHYVPHCGPYVPLCGPYLPLYLRYTQWVCLCFLRNYRQIGQKSPKNVKKSGIFLNFS